MESASSIILQLVFHKHQITRLSVDKPLSGKSNDNTKAYSHEIHKITEPILFVFIIAFYDLLSCGFMSSTSLPDLIIVIMPEKW